MTISELVAQYGIEPGIIAFAVIFLVGLIKVLLAKPLAKIDKPNRKPIYETLSLIFAFGFTAAWLATKGAWFHLEALPFSWELVLERGAFVYAIVKVVYPLYENYRLRDLVQLIGRGLVALFSRKKVVKQEAVEEGNKDITVL